MVEFALVLPLLLLLALGVGDFGRVYQQQNSLTNAVREGAALGQNHPLSVSGCRTDDSLNGQDITTQVAHAGGLALDGHGAPTGGWTLTVTYTHATNAPVAITGCASSGDVASGDTLTVTVTDKFGLITPFIGRAVGADASDELTISKSVNVVVQ